MKFFIVFATVLAVAIAAPPATPASGNQAQGGDEFEAAAKKIGNRKFSIEILNYLSCLAYAS